MDVIPVIRLHIGQQMNEPTTKASKFLSLVLRHQPESIGISLDESGWASIADLIEKSREARVFLSVDLIRKIVTSSNKMRFSISADGLRIRANQGHSVDIDLGLEAAEPPLLLYHGTATRNLASIRGQGLIKGNRQYVHLSLSRETAVTVGKRHGKPVVLIIEAGSMHKHGFEFYLSANGVWLTEHVPPEYVTTR